MKTLKYFALAFALSTGTSFAADTLFGVYEIDYNGEIFRLDVRDCGNNTVCGKYAFPENLKGKKSFWDSKMNDSKTAGGEGKFYSASLDSQTQLFSVKRSGNKLLVEIDAGGAPFTVEYNRIAD